VGASTVSPFSSLLSRPSDWSCTGSQHTDCSLVLITLNGLARTKAEAYTFQRHIGTCFVFGLFSGPGSQPRIYKEQRAVPSISTALCRLRGDSDYFLRSPHRLARVLPYDGITRPSGSRNETSIRNNKRFCGECYPCQRSVLVPIDTFSLTHCH
jgi:hypothetical protein